MMAETHSTCYKTRTGIIISKENNQVRALEPFTGLASGGTKAQLSARPEQLFFSETGMPGKVMFSTFLGDFIEYEVELFDGQTLIINEYTKDTAKVHEVGENVFISFDATRISLYDEAEEVLSK